MLIHGNPMVDCFFHSSFRLYLHKYAYPQIHPHNATLTSFCHGSGPPIVILYLLFQWLFGMPLNKSRGYTVEEEKFAKDLMSYWSNFAKYG